MTIGSNLPLALLPRVELFMRPWANSLPSLPFLCKFILKRPKLAAPGLIVAANIPFSLEPILSLSFAVKLLRRGSSIFGRLKFRTPNVFDGVIGEPWPDSASLRDALCRPEMSMRGSVGTFKLRILFCMCSFFGLPIGDRASSRLFRSLSSGRKFDWLADMLTLFYRLLLRTCSRLIFFFTLTSGICYCMLLKRLVLSQAL